MNILGSLGGGAQLGLGNLTGMTLGNLNAVLIGGTATLPSKEMFLGSAFQDGYFPRQWAAGTHEQGELVYCKTNIAGFFFDAVLNVSTEHTAVVTSHPVQTGANISDHMYLEPVQITMEIGMSDCMASMVRGQWVGAYTKSHLGLPQALRAAGGADSLHGADAPQSVSEYGHPLDFRQR